MADASACRLRRGPDHVIERDAWDFAREVIGAARTIRCRIIVVIFPDGKGDYWPVDATAHAMLNAGSPSIVGVYTCDAEVGDIHDDIIAMPRGRECDA